MFAPDRGAIWRPDPGARKERIMTPNEADRAVAAHWRPPIQRLLERALNRHPQRQQLEALATERDDAGRHVWEQVAVGAAEGWLEVWLRPCDARDTGRGIRIGAWPISSTDITDAVARVEEHDETIGAYPEDDAPDEAGCRVWPPPQP
jgi:hypothetical protein